MSFIVASDITSPLGLTTARNYSAVRAGQSALVTLHDWNGIPGRLTAGAFTAGQRAILTLRGFTFFQSLAIQSITEALQHTRTDVSAPGTVFILSTTKGDIAEFTGQPDSYITPGRSAAIIASRIGFSTSPIVVCNACVSGVSALILADRLLAAGEYDTAVVCGADCLTPFTVAGFTSFKSLSEDPCRPFDMERNGLNLGEGAATLILKRTPAETDGPSPWRLVAGAAANDAYHISTPSPSGDGAFRAVSRVMTGFPIETLATVAAHGTATLFNDQMESVAIERAGLGNIPVSAYKGYFGHTLGAAGILETALAMCAADDGTVLPLANFSESGVSGIIDLSGSERPASGSAVLKMISGFGGCNGALLLDRQPAVQDERPLESCSLKTLHSLHISPGSFVVDGTDIPVGAAGSDMLDEIFRNWLNDSPRFHKTDMLSRLICLSAGILLKTAGMEGDTGNISLKVFNATSSFMSDSRHLASFSATDGFYPSPSAFLYTLPNIAVGEASIRYGIRGETSLLILPEKNIGQMERTLRAEFLQSDSTCLIAGWADCSSETEFEADMKLIVKIKNR